MEKSPVLKKKVYCNFSFWKQRTFPGLQTYWKAYEVWASKVPGFSKWRWTENLAVASVTKHSCLLVYCYAFL